MKQVLVRDAMNGYPVAVRPHQPLSAAVEVMVDRDCGWVPVVDDGGNVVGVITDRDICLAAHDRTRPIQDIPVQGVMSTNVYTCSPDATLLDAHVLMRNRRVRRLPIVDDDGTLIGLLSLSDLARRAGRNDEQNPAGLTSRDVAHTLGAICEPSGSGG